MSKTCRPYEPDQILLLSPSVKGQIGDTVLNDAGNAVGNTTPYIWATVRFDAAGDFVNSPRACSPEPKPQSHQIFATYTIFRNGVQFDEHIGCDAEVFMALDSSARIGLADFNRLIR